MPNALGKTAPDPTRSTVVCPSAVNGWKNCSPVTLLRSQMALPTMSAFSCASFSAVAPFFCRSATVVAAEASLRDSADGVYQIGVVQARSCPVSGTTSGGGSPAFTAWISVQRGVGISSTRT